MRGVGVGVWAAVWVVVWVGVGATKTLDGVGGRTKGGRPPNILVLLADDLGSGDLGCYGNHTINTPNIDRLASEGVRLSHHLSASSMCTPSRAALLTSRYPVRYGLEEDYFPPVPVILHTTSKAGLPLEEVTLATALSHANYTTAIVGKWHLGLNCSFGGGFCPGPLHHGFQSFYGMPVTLYQDLKGTAVFWKFPLHETKFQGLAVSLVVVVSSLLLGYRKGRLGVASTWLLLLLSHLVLFIAWFQVAHMSLSSDCEWGVSKWLFQFANSMLMRDGRVVERPIELDGLSQRLVEESRSFLTARAQDKAPFFLYHAFGHVHTPMFTAEHMKGRSQHGRYGDNVEEMDASVGAIMETLRDLGLEDNTLVYFTSDQGGHLEAVEDGTMERIGGHNGRYKGGKRQGGSEGGIQVPGIYRWSGQLPAGVTVTTPTSLMDLMPTVLSLAGLPPLHDLLPRAKDKELDGIDISELLLGNNGKDNNQKKTPERFFLHHCGKLLHALRLHKGDRVYKMNLYKTRWHKGSTQCGWHHSRACDCFRDVEDHRDQPILRDLTLDPYEDHPPITPDTDEYRTISVQILRYLDEWRSKVQYAPSQLSTMDNIAWHFWLQPHLS